MWLIHIQKTQYALHLMTLQRVLILQYHRHCRRINDYWIISSSTQFTYYLIFVQRLVSRDSACYEGPCSESYDFSVILNIAKVPYLQNTSYVSLLHYTRNIFCHYYKTNQLKMYRRIFVVFVGKKMKEYKYTLQT